MKNFLLFVLLFAIVGYTYITISERQKQRLIRERRPKLQEMVNKYEFRRALYQIRETKERIKNEDDQRPQQQQEEEYQRRENPEQEVDELDQLKNEPSTPAQPIENPSPADDRPIVDGTKQFRKSSGRGEPLYYRDNPDAAPPSGGRYGTEKTVLPNDEAQVPQEQKQPGLEQQDQDQDQQQEQLPAQLQ